MADPAALPPRWRQRLLAWFDRNQRDLPWRVSRDPYAIWISEVMLQQTTVATVIPYFHRFLVAFPSVAALADAKEEDVLRLWEGLGYYRRARNVHRAARIIQAEHGGVIPRDAAALRRLPGMGRYTVNAVLSQAHDLPLPILEANSRRVLCRLFGRSEDPTRAPLSNWLWQTAEDILPARRVGDFNQAVMELGALVCVPDSPRCGECPLHSGCEARKRGLQDDIPFRPDKRATTDVFEVAVVPRRGSLVFIVRRPAIGRWANMWEFPHAEVGADEHPEDAVGRVLKQLTGLSGKPGRELMTIRHGVTRWRITMTCFEARGVRGVFRSDFHQEGRWVDAEELEKYPISSPQRRLARGLK